MISGVKDDHLATKLMKIWVKMSFQYAADQQSHQSKKSHQNCGATNTANYYHLVLLWNYHLLNNTFNLYKNQIRSCTMHEETRPCEPCPCKNESCMHGCSVMEPLVLPRLKQLGAISGTRSTNFRHYWGGLQLTEWPDWFGMKQITK